LQELRNAVQWCKNFRATGDGVRCNNTPTGATVTVTAAASSSSTTQTLRSVIVKVTGAASGGGKYNGQIVNAYPTSDVSASGNLASSDIGTTSGSTDTLVLNMQEMGLATHDLTSGTPVATYFIGVLVRTNADGTYVVAINGLDTAACT
jgi:hypothetical protein